MFPTSVGMNRILFAATNYGPSVPHERGDEPSFCLS